MEELEDGIWGSAVSAKGPMFGKFLLAESPYCSEVGMLSDFRQAHRPHVTEWAIRKYELNVPLGR